MNVFTNPGWGYDLAVILFYTAMTLVPVTELISAVPALPPVQSGCAIYSFPFTGHLSLTVCAQFCQALAAPSQGRRDRDGRSRRGAHPSLTLLKGHGQELPWRQHPHHHQPFIALLLRHNPSQGPTELTMFRGGGRCLVSTSPHLLPHHLLPTLSNLFGQTQIVPSFPAWEAPDVNCLLPEALMSRAKQSSLLYWKIKYTLYSSYLLTKTHLFLVPGTRRGKEVDIMKRTMYSKWLQRVRNTPN